MSSLANTDYQDPVEVIKKINEDNREWKQLTSSERDQIDFKMRRAIMQLIFFFPFFGFMAAKVANNKIIIKSQAQLEGISSGGEPFRTMATDGKNLYIWPQYVLYNSVNAVMGTIMHELFHIIFLHIARGIGYNQQLANIAMDHTVNMMVNDLARESVNIPKTQTLDERTYRQMPWYVGCPPALYNEKYRDQKTGDPWIWEKIYEDLLKQQSPEMQKQLQGGGGTGGGALNGVDSNQGMHDSHDFWNPNNRPKDEDGNSNTDKFDTNDVRNMVRDAYVQATESKMRGTMPASMERMIQEWLHPPMPWHKLVQNYLKPANGNFGYEPGDLRFNDPIPWFIPEYKLRKIVIAIDTSGSMSDQEVSMAITQSRHLLKSYPQVQGILCMCDAAVSYWADIKETYKIQRRVGYGGTDFSPPFEKIIEEKIQNDTDLLIYFTDGYGNFPNENWLKDHKINFDTLWVVTNNDVTPPKQKQYRWTRLNPIGAVPGRR